jgi:hypothetical protein
MLGSWTQDGSGLGDSLDPRHDIRVFADEDYLVHVRVWTICRRDSSRTWYEAAYNGPGGPLLHVAADDTVRFTLPLVKQLAGGGTASVWGRVSGVSMCAQSTEGEACVLFFEEGRHTFVAAARTSNGSYSAELPPGRYRAMVRSGNESYPQYVGGGDSWTQARVLALDPAQPLVADCALPAFHAKSDLPGSISGVIRSDGIPTGLALLTVKNSNGSIVGFAFSDAAGRYTITNLPYGHATLHTGCTGYVGTSREVDIAVETPHLSADFDLGAKLLSVRSASSAPEAFSLSKNFPNPFPAKTEITIAIPHRGEAIVTVSDLLGRVVILSRLQLEAGVHRIPLSLDRLNVGTYFYSVHFDGVLRTRPMTLLR